MNKITCGLELNIHFNLLINQHRTGCAVKSTKDKKLPSKILPNTEKHGNGLYQRENTLD